MICYSPVDPLHQISPYASFFESNHWPEHGTCTHTLIRDEKQQDLQNWLECHDLLSDFDMNELQDEVIFRVNDNDSVKRKLSPLHIASMTGNLEAAKSLVKTGVCDLNARDLAGATPMHHAAVRADAVFMQFLKDNGADDHIQDNYGGTALDVLRQCHPSRKPEEQRFFYVQNEKLIEGNGHDFDALTQSQFIDQDIIQTPTEWIKEWKRACQMGDEFREEVINSPFQQYLCFLHDSFLKQSPKLYLDKDDIAGHILRAGEDIPPFTVIGEYLGEINSERSRRYDIELQVESKNNFQKFGREAKYCYSSKPLYNYRLNEVDAFYHRGLMAMMPSSFPNVITYALPFNRGQESRAVFITISAVKKGSILAFDYGEQHDVKKMPYAELRKDELLSFFRQRTPEQLLEALHSPNNLSKQPSTCLEEIAEESRVEYLLKTPTAMIQVLLGEIITHETVEALFKKQEEVKGSGYEDIFKVASMFANEKTMQEEFFCILQEFLLFAALLPKEASDPFKEIILDNCGKMSTLDLKRMIDDNFNENLSKQLSK